MGWKVQLISMLIAALLEDTSGCTPLHEVARRGCMQDFLGFLHLGWDIAACDGRNQEVLQLTEDASKTGISAVQQILGWSALHLAAMEGKVSNIEKLIKKFNCDVHCQSANTWTPLHYAAAYNQVTTKATSKSVMCCFLCPGGIDRSVGSAGCQSRRSRFCGFDAIACCVRRRTSAGCLEAHSVGG